MCDTPIDSTEMCLTVLQVLCLNHNHVESIAPKSKVGGKGSKYKEETDPYNAANFSPLLENLEVLHLG